MYMCISAVLAHSKCLCLHACIEIVGRSNQYGWEGWENVTLSLLYLYREPRVSHSSRRWQSLSIQSMLQASRCGSKVSQNRDRIMMPLELDPQGTIHKFFPLDPAHSDFCGLYKSLAGLVEIVGIFLTWHWRCLCADGEVDLDSTEEDYTDITDSSVSPRTAAAWAHKSLLNSSFLAAMLISEQTSSEKGHDIWWHTSLCGQQNSF